MATRLRKLRIGKVALCFRGANQQAEVLLYKSADPIHKDEYGEGDDAPPLTTLGRLRQRQLWQEWQPLWYAFNDSVHAMMDCVEGEDPEHAPLLLQSIAEFQSEAQRILTSLGLVGKAAPLFTVLSEVEKVGAVMSSDRKQRLRAALAALQAILDEAEPKPADTTKGAAMAETLKEAIDRADAAEAAHRAVKSAHAVLEHENETLKAELVAKSLTPEEQEAAYVKTLPEAVRKEREADKLEKAELKEALRVEKDKRERQEYIEKTATYRQVGLTPDHHNVLKAIDAMPEQERTELLRILKSASEVIKAGTVFKVAGKDGSAPVGDAGERIAKMATDKAAASDGKLTYHQAYALVLDEQPALYQEYRVEQKGRA